MVQASKTALFVAVVGLLVAVVTLAPLQTQHRQFNHRRNNYHQFDLVLPVDQGANPFKFIDAEDGTARSERSTNLSHITGTAKKIQIFVNNKLLQIMPDGTVNGVADDGSDYTIFQRTSVNNGQLKIQGVATCLFLCMDSCGLLYGSREFIEDCVFNESFTEAHYFLYSSARYSNKKRTLYLGINNRGQPRKVQIKVDRTLGKLSTYVSVLPKYVSPERTADLAKRILKAQEIASGRVPSANPIRHHGYNHVCPQVLGHELAEDADGARDKFRCRTRRKRKKKKRRCEEGEEEGECEVDTEDDGVDKNECEEGDEECSHKKLVTTQRVRTNNKNNRCEEGAIGCKKKERDQKKNRNQKKCENGEVGCKRREEERERRTDQRKDVQPMNRRRCQIEEDNEKCKKRLQESRRRRRARIRDKTIIGGQDENVATKKKLTSGKNKKKFVGDGEISKDLDSGRRLAEQLEIATNLNTPAEAITEATAKRSQEINNQEFKNLSKTPIPAEDSVTNAENIPSDNQRGNREETPEDSGETVDLEPASTPYGVVSTPAPYDFDVTSSDLHPHTDVTPAEATAMDYFYDDAVDNK